MLVYGDRARTASARDLLGALADEVDDIHRAPPGLPRHARIAGALVAAGGLAQGLADRAFHDRGGVDGRSATADLAQRLAGELALSSATSWRSDFARLSAHPCATLARLGAALGAEAVEVRTCEGFAFYAVYPELYVEAAAAMRPAPRIVGLRSIGASLSAAAAAGCGGDPPLTLRPSGDPFARQIRVAPGLAAELTAPSPGGWAVVDEGPGLSGSSFAAAADLLEAHGVPAGAVAFLPSHGGAPGAEAPPERRARWERARKPRVDFDDAIAPRLAAWAEPLVGPALRPMQDLSGGAWRAHVPAALRDAPAWPGQERRKFLLHTDAGDFLLKFAGLGAEGEAKLARARALHAAGFTVEPLGLLHGFLVEHWSDAAPLPTAEGGASVEPLADYLAFRALRLDPPEPGAGPERMREMMVRNLGFAGFPDAAALAARLEAGAPDRPVGIDGRLHRWEWRIGPHGRLLKTDALDHGQAHDLIGAQDLAWDVAGAAVEFALSAEDAERLRSRLARQTDEALDPRRVAFQSLGYLAFQIGWWRLAAAGGGGERAAAEGARYEDLARRWRPAA